MTDPGEVFLQLPAGIVPVPARGAETLEEIVIGFADLAAVLDPLDEGGMGSVTGPDIRMKPFLRLPLRDHVHDPVGAVAEQDGLRPLVDVNPPGLVGAHDVHEGVGPDADDLRDAVDGHLDFAAGPGASHAANVDGAAVAPSKAPDGILAGDDHAGDHPDGRLEIPGVEISDLVLRHGADLAPQAGDRIALRDGRCNDDHLLQAGRLLLLRGAKRRGLQGQDAGQQPCPCAVSLHSAPLLPRRDLRRRALRPAETGPAVTWI